MFTRTLPLVACLLGWLMMAGCSYAPKLERMDVQLKALTAGPDQATVTLAFINPNNIPLVVVATEHTLVLDGKSAGSFRNRKPLGLPAFGTVTETITFSGETAQSVARFAADHPGSAVYGLETTLRINWSDETYEYKTSGRGHVAVKTAAVAP